MREIEYRAWDKIDKEYVDWEDDLVLNDCQICIEDSTVIKNLYKADGYPDYYRDEHEAILEQFIGIKDKNGVKIFEGDIVKGNNNICEVFYHEYRAMFALEYITDNKTEKCLYPFDDWDMFEVIGNIHEHKNLLDNN